MNYTFEKNKLYAYLGKHLVSFMKDYNAYVAGGTVTSLFSNREINDVDVYFPNERKAIAFLSHLIEDGAWVVSHTKKATQLMYDEKNVQVIHFDYYETAEELFSSFDYTVCMGLYDFSTEEYVLHDDFLKHNSQRILKYNPKTSYPIVSMLRIQKYEDKGYKVSKPEFVRVVLSCMNLEINSYEELKDHMGGLYGENFDKLFEDVEDEDFDLEVAINKLADLALSEDYFKMPESKEYELDEIIKNISKEPLTYIETKNKKLIINYFGELAEVNEVPENHIKVDAEEYFSNNKLYKYVKKQDGRYMSFYNNSFEYKLCDQIVASNEGRNDGRLYFVERDRLEDATYSREAGRAVLEVLVNPDDIVSVKNEKIAVKKCYVVREVPEDEWKQWMKKDDDQLDLSGVPF